MSTKHLGSPHNIFLRQKCQSKTFLVINIIVPQNGKYIKHLPIKNGPIVIYNSTTKDFSQKMVYIIIHELLFSNRHSKLYKFRGMNFHVEAVKPSKYDHTSLFKTLQKEYVYILCIISLPSPPPHPLLEQQTVCSQNTNITHSE